MFTCSLLDAFKNVWAGLEDEAELLGIELGAHDGSNSRPWQVDGVVEIGNVVCERCFFVVGDGQWVGAASSLSISYWTR